MLTLADFVLEKFGGDTMDDVARRTSRATASGSPRRPRRRSPAARRAAATAAGRTA